MQHFTSLFLELQNAQRKLLKLFEAPDTMCNEGTEYPPMFPWPDTDRILGAYSNALDIRRDVYNRGHRKHKVMVNRHSI
jgi:hypothetical protein